MDRAIIFKGKRIDNGEWIEGCLLEYVTGAYIIGRRKDENTGYSRSGNDITIYNPCEVARETICQYVGLVDSNAIKIFEGDEVVCRGTSYTCKWNSHRAEFAWYFGYNYIYPIGDMTKYLKVIGNIHG